jgi:hypothetical protein
VYSKTIVINISNFSGELKLLVAQRSPGYEMVSDLELARN